MVPQEAADTAQAAPVPVTLLVVSSIVGLWEPVIAHDAVVRNGETQIGSDKCLSSKAAIDGIADPYRHGQAHHGAFHLTVAIRLVRLERFEDLRAEERHGTGCPVRAVLPCHVLPSLGGDGEHQCIHRDRHAVGDLAGGVE
ncbi:hypothetical protein XACb0034 (plasmid) [Xanthomonas citri pv. citri str. 306]|uniref:Uncharacterized protein n=1 Tax=Xanthomonas axonopodis pv. citri (strain 306) TaxID=190486 RepID=A0AAI8EUR0_XANAC|nr:hypothetical protein XACb0034 [Xanthomonas citri pv. citri str. 306]